MDHKTELHFKKILIDLEDEHKHLKVSIDHLKNEIRKREVEIRQLVAERELELAKEYPDYRKKIRLQVLQPTQGESEKEEKKTNSEFRYNSKFAEQVQQLLTIISKKSQTISTLIKL